MTGKCFPCRCVTRIPVGYGIWSLNLQIQSETDLSSQGVNGSCRSVGRFTVYKKRTIQSYISQVKHFKANIYSFLTFMFIYFLVQTLQCTEPLFFLFVLLMKVCMLKLLSKVGHFTKIAKNFNTAMTAQLAPNQDSFYLGYIILEL